MGKLKILCLHGYRQNETIFRERTGALRKLLKKEADFVFVTAPHTIPEPDNLTRPPDSQERGWFFSIPEHAYKGTDATDTCIGLDESLRLIKETFKEKGPFDGVLGFSQGACLLSLLSAMSHADSDSAVCYRFLIFISGFKSLLSPHSTTYPCSIDSVASFHIMGETDTIIPTHMSSDLATMYSDSIVYRHKGSHYIPASPDLRRSLQDFLRPFLD